MPGKLQVPCDRCGKILFRFKSQIRKRVFCPDCRKSPVEVRFWAKVDKTSSPNGCWLWTGSKHPEGYGCFDWHEIGEQRAHRIAWILTHGKIPDGKYVLHICPGKHNTQCVNPDHLEIGDQTRNMSQAMDQGTFFKIPKGEGHPNSLLSDEAVLEIRREYRRFNVKNLAAKFNVSIATIRDVAKGRSWSHVKPSPPQPDHPPTAETPSA